MKADARHYPADKDDSIDLYEQAPMIAERDGDLIRIEVSEGDPQQPWGAPGISIEMTVGTAIELMAVLSEVTMDEQAKAKRYLDSVIEYERQKREEALAYLASRR